jgi:hypothetical protein
MCGQATAKSHRFTDSNVSADLSGGSIPQRGHDPTRPSRSAGFYYHRTGGAEKEGEQWWFRRRLSPSLK